MAYTTIDDPSAYFQAKAYTGNGSNSYAITNDGNSDLQPDLWWVKNRDKAYDHNIYDSTRGTSLRLVSNSTSAEATATDRIASFDTNGFTLNSSVISNENNNPHVAWQWKANGGTTSSNTDGTITTTIQTNSDAGFSICRHDGNGTAGATFGHGLGVKPDFIISKRTDSITNWRCYHSSVGATKHILLNSTAAAATATDSWNDTEPTSSVVTVGSSSRTNASGSAILFYIFASKQGFSKFGSYEGNGYNSNFIYTGFKPAFIVLRDLSGGGWFTFDIKRDTYNTAEKRIALNDSAAEATGSFTNVLDFYSNGFRVINTDSAWNGGSRNYIYIAFAENPFVTSTGIPTTAR